MGNFGQRHTHRIDSDALSALHDRFVRGELEAGEQFASQLLGYLVRRLGRRFPHAPFDLRADAAEDALLDHLHRPDRFDRSRKIPIEAYLSYAACRNLANSLDSERRRKEREARYASEVPSIVLAEDVPERKPAEALITTIAAASSAEKRALELWLGGERRTTALAEALGIEGLPTLQQRSDVKRFKDRVLKRLVRHLRHTPQSR